jgi:hypothetical protein
MIHIQTLAFLKALPSLGFASGILNYPNHIAILAASLLGIFISRS